MYRVQDISKTYVDLDEVRKAARDALQPLTLVVGKFSTFGQAEASHCSCSVLRSYSQYSEARLRYLSRLRNALNYDCPRCFSSLSCFKMFSHPPSPFTASSSPALSTFAISSNFFLRGASLLSAFSSSMFSPLLRQHKIPTPSGVLLTLRANLLCWSSVIFIASSLKCFCASSLGCMNPIP